MPVQKALQSDHVLGLLRLLQPRHNSQFREVWQNLVPHFHQNNFDFPYFLSYFLV